MRRTGGGGKRERGRDSRKSRRQSEVVKRKVRGRGEGRESCR